MLIITSALQLKYYFDTSYSLIVILNDSVKTFPLSYSSNGTFVEADDFKKYCVKRGNC